MPGTGSIRKVMKLSPTRQDVWLRAGSRGAGGRCDWRTDDHEVRARWIVSFEYPDGSDNALAVCDDCLQRMRELYPEAPS
jgi:hypothetical protein